MPAARRHVPPKYRLHKASGQAFIQIRGKRIYLGKFGTEASRQEYERKLAELRVSLAGALQHREHLTVAELLLAFRIHASGHYQKHGTPTKTIDNIDQAVRPLLALYAELPVREFSPLKLKAIRERMIDQKRGDGQTLSRGVINERIRIIRHVFKWGVEEELVPVEIYQALETVAGLARGRSRARETTPVPPVDDETIAATSARLPPVVADMVRFQRLTGCRPGEVCSLRPCDVQRTSRPDRPLPLFDPPQKGKPKPPPDPARELDVWEYRPARHKTEHHGRQRIVLIGPRAQEILLRYLARAADAFCFSPAESEVKRHTAMRLARQSRVPPSQEHRRKQYPQRSPRLKYTKDSYARAVRRACDLAFPPPKEMIDPAAIRHWRKAHRWSPNQLRHTAATEFRRRFGLEAAQVMLGHARADVTQIYAETDLALARSVAREVG
jgi:integrase